MPHPAYLRMKEIKAQEAIAGRLTAIEGKLDAIPVQPAEAGEHHAALLVKLDAILARLDNPPTDQSPRRGK